MKLQIMEANPGTWIDSYLKNINNIELKPDKNNTIILHRNKSRNIKKFIDIEKNGNILFPTSNYMTYYENKVNLFRHFTKCNVKIPQTHYCNNLKQTLKIKENLIFPIVIKKCYSCYSDGMVQCLKIKDYGKIITDFLKINKECIIQRKINFTKEVRLTYIGNEIVHGYYRIKKNERTVSGCSKFGSICSFDIDLKKYQKFIDSFIKKTGFDIGGIDIVWENNDENVEPYVLEVSPIFDVNPPPPSNFKDSYKLFKNSNLHNKLKSDLINKITKKTINYVIKKYSKSVIYCDIDSTINNHEKRIKKWYNTGLIDPKAFTYDEIMKDDILINSVESNHKLYEKYNIYFITARKKFPNAYNSTKDWLDKHNFRYDKIILTNNLEEKINFLKNDSYLNVFIDNFTKKHHLDTPILDTNNIEKIKNENIPFIIFKNNWREITEQLI